MALSVDYATIETMRHVVARSRANRALYADQRQRIAIARQLAESCTRHRLRCLVWSATDRRLHVVLRGAPASITLATHELLGSRIRHGHWQSTVVRYDLYLLEVARHALLAPVRAGLCRQIADWPFSSARESLGMRPAPPWMDLLPIYDLLGARDEHGGLRLRRFMECG